jgi:hypothetical protein
MEITLTRVPNNHRKKLYRICLKHKEQDRFKSKSKKKEEEILVVRTKYDVEIKFF